MLNDCLRRWKRTTYYEDFGLLILLVNDAFAFTTNYGNPGPHNYGPMITIMKLVPCQVNHLLFVAANFGHMG